MGPHPQECPTKIASNGLFGSCAISMRSEHGGLLDVYWLFLVCGGSMGRCCWREEGTHGGLVGSGCGPALWNTVFCDGLSVITAFEIRFGLADCRTIPVCQSHAETRRAFPGRAERRLVVIFAEGRCRVEWGGRCRKRRIKGNTLSTVSDTLDWLTSQLKYSHSGGSFLMMERLKLVVELQYLL
jgi:hypothetical protein